MNKRKYFLMVSGGFILVVIVFLFLNYNYLKFEYYVWDFSNENISKREQASVKVIKMGEKALPLLIDKLDHPYIFESYYIAYCLKEISHDTIIDINYADFKNKVIPYWKNWWKKNSYRYK